MIALREFELIRPDIAGQKGRENRAEVHRSEVWLVRWLGTDFTHSGSAERVFELKSSKNQRFYTVIEGTQGESILVEEHDFETGKVQLTSWTRISAGFQKSVELEVDDLLSISRKGAKFLARKETSLLIGDCRTLQTLRTHPSTLTRLGAWGSTSRNCWISSDGRYLVRSLAHDSRDPLTVEIVDLDKCESTELSFSPRDNWVDLAYAETVQGDLRLVIGYGRSAEGFKESWTYEVVDSRGGVIRPLKIAGSLQYTGNMNHGVLWDVEGKRFLVPVDRAGLTRSAIDILGEGGESLRVIPKLPKELPETTR